MHEPTQQALLPSCTLHKVEQPCSWSSPASGMEQIRIVHIVIKFHTNIVIVSMSDLLAGGEFSLNNATLFH